MSGFVCSTAQLLALHSEWHAGIIGNNGAVIAKVIYSEGRKGVEERRKKKDDTVSIEVQSK